MRTAGIGHGQDALAVMAQIRPELILDGIARAAHAGAGRITALNHEAINNAVENHLVIEAFLCQLDEVAGSNRRLVLKQLNLKLAHVGVKNCNTICHFILSFAFPEIKK